MVDIEMKKKMSFPSGHLGGQFIHSFSAVAYALVCLKKVKEKIGELYLSCSSVPPVLAHLWCPATSQTILMGKKENVLLPPIIFGCIHAHRIVKVYITGGRQSTYNEVDPQLGLRSIVP